MDYNTDMTNTQTFRKIKISFKDEESMNALSDKLFIGTDHKLLVNMKEVTITKTGYNFKFKRVVHIPLMGEKECNINWTNMTPFTYGKKKPWGKIHFLFGSEFTNEELSDLLEQNITIKSNSLWFPIATGASENLDRVIGTRGNPQYPIYVISKGRSDRCATADHLIKMDVPFRIVIEKSEWEEYSKYYDESILLELDLSFRDDYDTYIKDFDSNKSKGSGPVRNFVWWHAKNVAKSEYHWIMDDNIYGFAYYLHNKRLKAVDGTIFAAAEDFVNRYTNIGIAGLNYYMFVVPICKDRPYVSNTKVYSCLLINNKLPIRWAARYNEDVDLCIRALKEGYSTIQFDAYLSKKAGTQTMQGGNTDAFYAEEGTLPKSNMLAHNHPDITHVQWRFQRWHHMTDYAKFNVNKDRTIGQTIEAMMKEPILSIDSDVDIIQQIKNLDLNWIKEWNILSDVPEPKRTEIIDVLKFYRYTKNNDLCIDKLTAPKLLTCDYYDYIWGADIPHTPDNELMLKLLALGNKDGILRKALTQEEWDNVCNTTEHIKHKIITEMQRNKYLLMSDYPKYEYNLKTYTLSEEDHVNHHDSKARILNKFVNNNTELTEPVTTLDTRLRNPIQQTKKAFKANLIARYHKAVKSENTHSVMIHGCYEFNDQEFFNSVIANLNIPDEIISSVKTPADLMAANYALDNKLKTREFVPDDATHTVSAIKQNYVEMAEYADECILFIEQSNNDLNYLIELFEQNNKKITIHRFGTNTESLDEW